VWGGETSSIQTPPLVEQEVPFQTRESVVKNKNMVMKLGRLETKSDCAGEDQQQFTKQAASRKSETGVAGYQPRVLSCIVRRRYQATTSEAAEDLMFAAVICRVCRLGKLLKLFVVTSYKRSIHSIINAKPVSGH
jgi:hypothetical protein